MTRPDFAILAALIRSDSPTMPRRLLEDNLDTILAALDLAPVGHAAVSYHDTVGQMERREAWLGMERAVGEWKEGQTS